MNDIADGLRSPLFPCMLEGDLLDMVNKQRADGADEIERLREALYECARYLEEQVSASYWHIEQPFDANTQRRYARDMARAHKAFAALEEKE